MSERRERIAKFRHRYAITDEHCARGGFHMRLGGCQRRVRVVDISERALNKVPITVAEVNGSLEPSREWAVPAQVFRQPIREDPDVLGHVRLLQQQILDDGTLTTDNALDKLSAVPMNLTILMETGVGKTVNRLKRQASSPDIKSKSAKLISRWKELASV